MASAETEPDTHQLPSSRSTRGGSVSKSAEERNLPAIAVSRSPGVTSPSKWPYSSWTKAIGTSESRSTVIASIASSWSGTTGAGFINSRRLISLPASRQETMSRAWTTPISRSTEPSATGIRLCGASISFCRTVAMSASASIQETSVRGVITSRVGRSASRTTEEIIARSLSSSTPAVAASATTRWRSSAVT